MTPLRGRNYYLLLLIFFDRTVFVLTRFIATTTEIVSRKGVVVSLVGVFFDNLVILLFAENQNIVPTTAIAIKDHH